MNYSRSNTRLKSIQRVEKFSTSAQSQTFLVDLEHRLCGGRRICATSKYLPSVTMSYRVDSVTSVGQSTYDVLIQYSGTLSYLPYAPNSCRVCPVSEPFFGFVSIPVYATGTAPTVDSVTVDISDATPVVTPIIEDCCTVTRDVLVSAAFTANS